MQFLDRNTLPRFQERLDLSASELNDAEDIIAEAINELAGRVYILANMVNEEDRHTYAEETNCKLLSTLDAMQTFMVNLETRVDAIESAEEARFVELENRMTSFERRLNALDDAAARKQDLAVVLWRTAVALNKGDMNNDGSITLADVIMLLNQYQGGSEENDQGPEEILYSPSTCAFHNNAMPRVDHTNRLEIYNDNIADLKHTVEIKIQGSMVDSFANAHIELPKGQHDLGLNFDSSVYSRFVGQGNALWIEVYTYADNGDNTWEYIGKTTNKFTLSN